MIPRPRPAALVSLLVVLTASPAVAATPGVIEREFRYDAGRFSVVQKGGETEVEMQGAAREFVPGRPDLPLTVELIDLPADAQVAGVEVVSLGTELLSASTRIPTAARA